MDPKKLSPNGAVIATGKGVESVRKHIRDAFQRIHSEPITNKSAKKYDTSNEIAISENPDDVFARVLADMNVPDVQDASHKLKDEVTTVSHGWKRSYWVKPPKKSAQELIADALAEMQRRKKS
jgi:hypothetical protein